MRKLCDDFLINRYHTNTNMVFRNLISELNTMRDFLCDYSLLSFGKDFETTMDLRPFNLNKIIQSSSRTLKSITCCTINSNIADVFTLIRKLRDDLFFYIYIIEVSHRRCFNLKTKQDELILAWTKNNLSNLQITSIFKYIAERKEVKDIIYKYNLKDKFDKLSITLNNYVHSNGMAFYNEPFFLIQASERTEEICTRIRNTTASIIIVFTVLLSVIKPIMIISNDYVDSLDVGIEPNKDMLYSVAPFIPIFLQKYSYLIDDDIITYLEEELGIKF